MPLGKITVEQSLDNDSETSTRVFEPNDLLTPHSAGRIEFLSVLAGSDRSAAISWHLEDILNEAYAHDPDEICAAVEWIGDALGRYAPWLEITMSPDVRKIASTAPELLEPFMRLPLAVGLPNPHGKYGWDSLVDPWVDHIPQIGGKIPGAYRIWQSSRRYLEAGELERSRRCEELNYLLHNSYVSARLNLRGEVTFAYGGIGVIVHHDADIYPGVTIGANVTIGSSGSSVRVDSETGKRMTVPLVREYVTIGACANISGGVELGPMSIVAPNSVVTKSVGAGEIVAGAPARTIGRVTRETALRYKVKYLPARSLSDDQYMEIVQRLLPESY